MDAVDLSLIVELFESKDKFAEGKISLFKAVDGDGTLVDRPDTENELAEVSVILVREDAIEEARAQAIDVQKQLPSLVTA